MARRPPEKLRRGWTTGACAAACVYAAYEALLAGRFPDPVTIMLPKGQQPAFPLSRARELPVVMVRRPARAAHASRLWMRRLIGLTRRSAGRLGCAFSDSHPIRSFDDYRSSQGAVDLDFSGSPALRRPSINRSNSA